MIGSGLKTPPDFPAFPDFLGSKSDLSILFQKAGFCLRDRGLGGDGVRLRVEVNPRFGHPWKFVIIVVRICDFT